MACMANLIAQEQCASDDAEGSQGLMIVLFSALSIQI